MYTRTRVTNVVPESSFLATGKSKYRPTGAVDQFGTQTTIVPSSERCMQDVVTPNFRKLLASGHIVNNPMSIRHDQPIIGMNLGSWTSTASDTDNWFEGTGCVTKYYLDRHNGAALEGPNIDLEAELSDLRSQMSSSLKRQMIERIDKTPYSFMEDLFELKGTLNLLRKPISSMKDVLDESIRKHKLISRRELGAMKNAKHIRQALNTASKAWLNARFNYGSFYYSAENILKEYTEAVKNKPIRRTVSDFSDRKLRNTYDQKMQKYAGEFILLKRFIDCNMQIKVGLLYQTSNPIDTWRERNGFRLKEIPVTLWNIMPYTWATDRLFNMSSCIKGLTNLVDPTITILAGWVVESTSIYDTTSVVSCSNLTNVVSFSPDEYGRKGYYKSRYVWTPAFSDTVPQFENPVDGDITKTIDLIALVMGKLTRFR